MASITITATSHLLSSQSHAPSPGVVHLMAMAETLSLKEMVLETIQERYANSTKLSTNQLLFHGSKLDALCPKLQAATTSLEMWIFLFHQMEMNGTIFLEASNTILNLSWKTFSLSKAQVWV
jgi:hypothetical protein